MVKIFFGMTCFVDLVIMIDKFNLFNQFCLILLDRYRSSMKRIVNLDVKLWRRHYTGFTLSTRRWVACKILSFFSSSWVYELAKLFTNASSSSTGKPRGVFQELAQIKTPLPAFTISWKSNRRHFFWQITSSSV